MKHKIFVMCGLSLILFFVLFTDVYALRYKPFSPYRYEIQDFTASGRLKIGDPLLDVKKLTLDGQILYLFRESGVGSFGLYKNYDDDQENKKNNKNGVYGVKLATPSSDIKICYYVVTQFTNSEGVADSVGKEFCGQDVSLQSSVSSIYIASVQKLEEIVKSRGVLNQDVKNDILSFSVSGSIDSQPLSISGKFIYDNTEEAKDSYNKRVSWGLFMYDFGGPIYLIVAVLVIFIVYKVLRAILRKIFKKDLVNK